MGIVKLWFLIVLLLIPCVYATININPIQPVIEDDNRTSRLWIHVNSTDTATLINLSHNGVQKTACNITNNLSNCFYTFNYNNDNTILNNGFETGAVTYWLVSHYLGRTDNDVVASGCEEGTYCVNVTKLGGDVDTAWEIQSYNFPVDGGKEYNLSFWSAHNIDLSSCSGTLGSWMSGFQYYNSSGSFIGGVTFTLGTVNEDWHLESQKVILPLDVTSMAISFGFDQPNMVAGNYFTFDNVTLVSEDGVDVGGNWTINVTNATGEIESRNITVGKFNMTEKNTSCQRTFLDYVCEKEYDIHYDYTSPQQYSLISVTDDYGTFRTEFVYNITGQNKILAPEYSAKWDLWDFEGLMRAGSRLDESNEDYGLWHYGLTPQFYKYNSTHYWVGSTDYYGFVNLGMWDGDTDLINYTSSDWGYFHGAGTWCDILPEGGDGLPEFIAVEDSGYMLVYNVSTPTFTWTQAYQSSDFGASSWGIKPLCTDVDGDGDNDSIMRDVSGRLRWINASGTGFEEHTPSTDYGSIYSLLVAKDIDNDGVMEFIITDTDGYVEIVNWSGTSFVREWISGDLGYFYYVDILNVLDLDRDGDLDIMVMDYYGEIWFIEQTSQSAYTSHRVFEGTYLSYTRPECIKDREGFCHFINGFYATGDLVIMDYLGEDVFPIKEYNERLFRKYRKADSNTFHIPLPLHEDFDGDGDEEVLYPTDSGFIFYFDLINKSMMDLDFNYSRGITMFGDYMKKEPETRLIDGKVYCYNDVNVALNELNITKNDGTPVSPTRLTDGIFSTDVNTYLEQGSSNYGYITSGVDKWLQLTLENPRNIGKLRWVGDYSSTVHAQNTSIAISLDHSTWTTVWNTTEDYWLGGAEHHEGHHIYFEPQQVKYIRIYMNGRRYDYTSSATNNRFTELEAYEGNNCSFMFMPSKLRNANIGTNYSMGLTTQRDVYYNRKYNITDEFMSYLKVEPRWIINQS